MKKIIAIQADKINSINIKTDTTFQLALEAQNRGYRIFWYEIKDLNLLNKRVIAKADQVKFFDNSKNYFKKINKSNLDLSKTKFVLMRQNPPFNMDYITATFYLEFLKKTKVINNPKSVRNISEKFYSINFLKMMPPTIFTENIQEIKKFLKKNRKIVIKPIHGFAGKYRAGYGTPFDLAEIRAAHAASLLDSSLFPSSYSVDLLANFVDLLEQTILVILLALLMTHLH